MTTTVTVADLVREHLATTDLTHSELLERVQRQRPSVTRASLHATLNRLRRAGELVCRPATRASALRLTSAKHPPAPLRLTLNGPVLALVQGVQQGLVLNNIWQVAELLRSAAPEVYADDTTAGREQTFLAYWRGRGLFAPGWPLRFSPHIEFTA
jgi:hypothetical protein